MTAFSSPVKVISFEKALTDSQQFSKRHLLLGNGFSIACRPKIFSYSSLLGQAKSAGAFASMPEVETVFDELGTQDFELVIRMLEDMAKILPAYRSDGFPKTTAKLKKQASVLKDLLIKTVGGN